MLQHYTTPSTAPDPLEATAQQLPWLTGLSEMALVE